MYKYFQKWYQKVYEVDEFYIDNGLKTNPNRQFSKLLVRIQRIVIY